MHTHKKRQKKNQRQTGDFAKRGGGQGLRVGWEFCRQTSRVGGGRRHRNETGWGKRYRPAAAVPAREGCGPGPWHRPDTRSPRPAPSAPAGAAAPASAPAQSPGSPRPALEGGGASHLVGGAAPQNSSHPDSHPISPNFPPHAPPRPARNGLGGPGKGVSLCFWGSGLIQASVFLSAVRPGSNAWSPGPPSAAGSPRLLPKSPLDP